MLLPVPHRKAFQLPVHLKAISSGAIEQGTFSPCIYMTTGISKDHMNEARMQRHTQLLTGCLLLLISAGSSALPVTSTAQEKKLPAIEEKTAGMTSLEGFFHLYWSDGTGKLFLEINRWDTEFLYQVSLATGLGSNPVGLDRGQLGRTMILTAHRVGPKVLLIQPNYRYRARTDDPDEARAVEEAFAPSTRWAFEVVAATGDRVLVDATGFFLRDAHNVTGTLKRTGQGSYRLDKSRSVFYLPRTKAFPLNTEIETSLTFTSEQPGRLVSGTAASGDAITLREHHSLVQLPDAGYKPRAADPRVGFSGLTFADYATPIDQPLDVRWIARHRLEKKNPGAAPSEPVRPIVYYVDRGTPEPIRAALIEGASWWNQAFEAAGFINAFRVEVLPEGTDPMDLRYNVIHWTHRATRGWSYGASVTDPRTGEILKANVNLGSLRLRQDHLLGVGLSPTLGGAFNRARSAGSTENLDRIGACDICAGPTFGYLAELAPATTPAQMALARVRQLSAHEVGHTLGLAHNYIASTYGRASVMDYPAPLVRIKEGELDLSDAYATGIGKYDKFAITWGYGEFDTGTDEKTALDSIVRDGLKRGIRFLTDQDARPAGGAHPLAALWDNGADPIAELEHEIEVRRIGLQRFGEESIRESEPLSNLGIVLVPLYLHHRYQMEAAAKSIGGADYSFALRGDGQVPIRIVDPERQKRALEAVLETISPDFLALPERILNMIPPGAFRFGGGERFGGSTGLTFDPIGAAATAADLTLSFVLQPQRMARLVEYNSRDDRYPGLAAVVNRLLDRTWKARPPASAYKRTIWEAVNQITMTRLMHEAAEEQNSTAVRAELTRQIVSLSDWIGLQDNKTAAQLLARTDIKRWLERAFTDDDTPARSVPPGSPIGRRR